MFDSFVKTLVKHVCQHVSFVLTSAAKPELGIDVYDNET